MVKLKKGCQLALHVSLHLQIVVVDWLGGEGGVSSSKTSKHTESYIPYNALLYRIIQCVPLATEPGISLIILTPMKILQRNLNRSTFVV